MNAGIILKILDLTSAYVIVLDSEMKIRYINSSLIELLGYKEKTELIDRCWLDFVNPIIKDKVKKVHRTLLTSFKNQYNEFTNEIITKDGLRKNIKWLNTSINHSTNWTFSIGIPERINLNDISEDEIRTHFKSVIESDRTMIKTLKEYIKGIPQSFGLPDTCDLDE